MNGRPKLAMAECGLAAATSPSPEDLWRFVPRPFVTCCPFIIDVQDGLEAPPEEELPDPDLMLDADEDLSFASMFAAALGDGAAGDKAGKRGASEAVTGSASTQPGLGLTSAGGSLFQGIDVDAMAVGAMEPTPPRSVKPGSIALGGLLAGTPGSPFGSVPSSSPFGGFGASPSPLGEPRPSPLGEQHPLADPAIAHLGAPQPVVASLPGGPAPVSFGTHGSARPGVW